MKEKKEVKPFFHRFLENQVKEKELNYAKGGLTLKFPSDDDEDFGF
jgi:hypothetical protein